MLKEGSPRKRLLDALKPGSTQLKEELPKFVECCDNIKIITFYEVKPTNRVVTVSALIRSGRLASFSDIQYIPRS